MRYFRGIILIIHAGLVLVPSKTTSSAADARPFEVPVYNTPPPQSGLRGIDLVVCMYDEQLNLTIHRE